GPVTETSTLSLHDALPISAPATGLAAPRPRRHGPAGPPRRDRAPRPTAANAFGGPGGGATSPPGPHGARAAPRPTPRRTGLPTADASSSRARATHPRCRSRGGARLDEPPPAPPSRTAGY